MLINHEVSQMGQPQQTRQFERLWQQHRDRVWKLVARLSGNMDQADDLTQEVCLRALKAYGGFRGSAQPFTWFYRIAINVVYSQPRVPAPVPWANAEVVDLPTPDAKANPEHAAQTVDMRRRLWAALDRLPEDLRTCLILQHYEGLKHREIAEVLDVPMGTVASRIHTALRRLREELTDDAV